MASTVFTLPERIVAETVSALHAELCSNAASCENRAVIDSGEVCDVDVLGLQLLATLVADLSARRIEVVWDNLSIDLYQAADGLGLCGALQLEL